MSNKELPIPPIAIRDPKSAEMVRAWIAEEGLHCSINFGIWGEKEAISWGILLSDLARHVSDAMHLENKTDKKKTLQEIRRVFNDELDDSTADTEGSFV